MKIKTHRKGGVMKKHLCHKKFLRVERNIITALIVMIVTNFTFAQLSAEDSLLQEAANYMNNGYYKSAVNSLEKLLEINPNSARAYGELGCVYNMQGDFDEAIEMYHKCIKLDSSAIPIIMNLGNAYIDIGELDSAIAVHKFLIAKDSMYAGNYINLGDAYMKKEDIAQAQLCFENAIRLNNYSSLALVNLAMAYFNQKKYAEAIDKLFFVRNLDDWYPLLQERLADVSKSAESEFEKWVEKEPNNSEAHYYYAFSLWYTDERGDAIDELEEAIKLNNKVEKYYLTKAIWLHNEEEYEDAIEDCKKCLTLNPDNWKCQNRLSLCYSYLGDIGGALTHSKQSVEIDPFVPQSQLLLGEGYIANEQFKDAVESLNKALDNTIASGVKNPVVYLDLAIAYYKNGDYENALNNAMISKNMKFAEQNVKQDLERETNQLITNIQQKINQK
jgi:tetratricopeptide (TPR) repeat protein